MTITTQHQQPLKLRCLKMETFSTTLSLLISSNTQTSSLRRVLSRANANQPADKAPSDKCGYISNFTGHDLSPTWSITICPLCVIQPLLKNLNGILCTKQIVNSTISIYDETPSISAGKPFVYIAIVRHRLIHWTILFFSSW